jgi:hypothetical protein
VIVASHTVKLEQATSRSGTFAIQRKSANPSSRSRRLTLRGCDFFGSTSWSPAFRRFACDSRRSRPLNRREGGTPAQAHQRVKLRSAIDRAIGRHAHQAGLNQSPLQHMRGLHTGELIVESLMLERKTSSVNAQQVKHCGMQVPDVDDVFH